MCDLTHGWLCVPRFSGVCHSHSLKMAANRLYDSIASGTIKRTALTFVLCVCVLNLTCLQKSNIWTILFHVAVAATCTYLRGGEWRLVHSLRILSLAFAPVCQSGGTHNGTRTAQKCQWKKMIQKMVELSMLQGRHEIDNKIMIIACLQLVERTVKKCQLYQHLVYPFFLIITYKGLRLNGHLKNVLEK